MRQHSFRFIGIVFAFIVTTLVGGAIASAKSMTFVAAVPRDTKVAGELKYDVVLERWGPPLLSPPSDFVKDGVISDECVKKLQKDETYQKAVAAEKHSGPLKVTLGKDGRWGDRSIEPGIYSLSISAFDKLTNERGQPIISHGLWVVSISTADMMLDLGTLTVPEGDHLVVGDKSPQMMGSQLNGQPFDSSIVQDKWHVVFFWATWCGPCLAELPEVAALGKTHPEVVLVGMCLDDDHAKAQHYCKQKGYGWPNISLGENIESPAAKAWGLKRLPHICLIDPTGKVAAVSVSLDQLRLLLKKH